MKSKTKFLKMYYKLPEKARKELVYNFPVNPMSLNECSVEIRNNTELGKRILIDLGFEND